MHNKSRTLSLRPASEEMMLLWHRGLRSNPATPMINVAQKKRTNRTTYSNRRLNVMRTPSAVLPPPIRVAISCQLLRSMTRILTMDCVRLSGIVSINRSASDCWYNSSTCLSSYCALRLRSADCRRTYKSDMPSSSFNSFFKSSTYKINKIGKSSCRKRSAKKKRLANWQRIKN